MRFGHIAQLKLVEMAQSQMKITKLGADLGLIYQRPREMQPQVQQRSNGRWVMVSERRTEDGGTVSVYSDITELKQREQDLTAKSRALTALSSKLAKYLAPQVYDSIFTGQQDVKIISKRKKLTVCFSDLVGFTEITDKLESEDLTQLLNHYLTEMSKIALQYGATIDKYVGDAIVMFFGDPTTLGVKEDALACVEMVIAMQKRVGELAQEWALGIKLVLVPEMPVEAPSRETGILHHFIDRDLGKPPFVE
jgi:Adenylate and Guanylate cyclase catalytic domain